MAQGTGSTGVGGFAFETVPGTYTAPTKYFPFNSESLKYQQDTQWRRPVRATADIVGAVAGNSHVEGDVQLEGLTDVIPYFLDIGRYTIVKTGTGPYTYTCTPNNNGLPARTGSFTFVRNGVVFGYTGCVLGGITFGVDDAGLLTCTAKIVGRDEAVQSNPTPTWPTSVPIGAGMYNLQIPTSTQVFDAQNLEFVVDDNASANYRMKSGSRAAQFISYGERAVSLKTTRDFQSRTEYDAFKSMTSQSITLQCVQDTNNEIDILVPVSVTDTFEVGLSGQGEVIAAQFNYIGALDSTGKSHLITIKTPETFTP